jgi:hypothetical protein
MFSGLSLWGDTSFEFSLGRSDHKKSAISLGGSGDHILDEISVSWSINNGEVILGGLELPEGNIDGDTSVSFGLELVHNPSILERSLSLFSGFLLVFFEGSLVNTSALVDEVTGGGGFTSIDVTNNDNVNVNFLFSHLLL